MVSHRSAGVPTWLNRATSPIRVPTAISRLEPLTRWSSCNGGTSVPDASDTELRSSASCLAKARRPSWRPGGRTSGLSAAGCRTGTAATSSSAPRVAMAARTARSLPTMRAVLASSSATSPARRGAVVVVPEAWSKSSKATPSGPNRMCLALSRPWATWAPCSAATWLHISVSCSSVTMSGSASAKVTTPWGGRVSSSAAPGPAVPATTTSGTRTPDRSASSRA